MERKVLIAIDDSDNAMRAVNFVAGFFSRNIRVTIFSVLHDTETICEYNSPGLTPYFRTERESFCKLEEKKKQLLEYAVGAARECLVNAGLDETNIEVKMEKRSKGVARDIIREADSGYDVVVLGKKGISGVQEFFFGSVSQKVINGVKKASVLVVT